MNILEDFKKKLKNILLNEAGTFRLIQIVAYWEKTKYPNAGFTNFPTEKEVEHTLDLLIDKIFIDMENGVIKPNKEIFTFSIDYHAMVFLREELLKIFLNVIKENYGIKKKQLDSLKKEINDIGANNKKAFLSNVYWGWIGKNELMKLMTITIFISYPDKNKKITNFDYDYVVDSVPNILQFLYKAHKKSSGYDNVILNSIDDKLDEPINKTNIKKFSNTILSNIQKSSHEYAEFLIKELILAGRKAILNHKK